MDKTIAAILAVLLAFTGLYLMMPEGLPGAGTSTKIADMPSEGNGMLGRIMDGLAELTWHPAQLFILILMVSASLAGMAVYWKRIKD
jgi:hypothetical protein